MYNPYIANVHRRYINCGDSDNVKKHKNHVKLICKVPLSSLPSNMSWKIVPFNEGNSQSKQYSITWQADDNNEEIDDVSEFFGTLKNSISDHDQNFTTSLIFKYSDYRSTFQKGFNVSCCTDDDCKETQCMISLSKGM